MCILSTNFSKIPVHIDHIGCWEAPAVGSLEMPGRTRNAVFHLSKGWVSCLLMWHSRILNRIISMKLGVLSMSTVYVHWPACRDFPAGWYKVHIV